MWPLFLVGLFLWGLMNSETGLPAWLKLERDLFYSEGRIRELKLSIEDLEAQATRLNNDPFSIEKAIRNDLKLALPGETIVIFEPKDPQGSSTP